MNKVINQVYQETDLSKFKKFEGNRELNPAHLRRLELSIKEENLLEASPIVVNQNLEIIDGQHRIEVAKKLGVPVNYILVKNLGLPQVQRLNSYTRIWSLSDYLQTYCELGLTDYIIFKDFIQKNEIPVNTGIYLVYANGTGGSESKTLLFREGKMKIESLSDMNKRMAIIKSFYPAYDGYLRRNFVLAVIKMSQIPNYNHKKMLSKLIYQSDKLKDVTTQVSYLRILEEIYNYKSQGTPLRFI